MHIGLLQTGHVADDLQPRNGDYPEIFARFLEHEGITLTNYAVVDGEFPQGAGDHDGWLITGSRHGAYEDHPWIAPLEALIRDIRDTGRPLVGICFGHQIIAQALGGKVEKFQGGWSVGAQDYTLGDQTYRLNAWHQDQVTALPPGAQVVCATDFCANAAVVYGDSIFTLQPHPEIDRTYISDLLEHRAPGVVPEDLRQEAIIRLDSPTDSAALAAIIAHFLRDRELNLAPKQQATA